MTRAQRLSSAQGRRRKIIAAGAAAFLALTASFAVGGAANNKTTTKVVQAAPIVFPTQTNRGVPADAVLSAYTGPTTINSCGTTISNKIVSSDLTINASGNKQAVWGDEATAKANACVVITNSRIKGIIDDSYTGRNHGPVFIADSEIANPTARDVAAVSQTNVHMYRSYVHGARSGVQCDGYCEIYDSFLLADTEFGAAHMDAFISNGAYGAPTILDHNSFLCKPTGPVPNGAGCAADVGLFADFSAQTNITMTNNQFVATNAAYYCIHTPYEPAKPYGTQGKNNNFSDNVFQRGPSGKCADAGPVYDWNNSAGFWCRNLFDDGTKVLPSNPDSCPSGPVTTTIAPVTTTTKPATTTTKAPVTTTTKVSTTTVPVTNTTAPPTTTTTVPQTFTVGPITCTIDAKTHAVISCN